MKKHLGLKNYLLLASLIFGMLFGAGNLIFPVHLGQLAGHNWLLAAGGFLLSGVLLPLCAIIAIAITGSNGIYELALPTGSKFALIFLILAHATLGPLFATPRTATVSYTIGIANYLPKSSQGTGLLVYSAIFFILVYFFSQSDGKITTIIGKVLNPIFLFMLFVIFFLAALNPMGTSSTISAMAGYGKQAFTNGFLQGYNTMDGLASLAFGITVITAIRALGINKRKDVSLTAAKSGAIGILGIGLIYLALVYLGAVSRHQFALADNGGITLAQIAHYYLGSAGDALLAALTAITCLTTAMGLIVAFAQDLHQRFPCISYQQFLLGNCVLSFLVANVGLDEIISWSTPVLMFLYPLAIMLIILGITSPLFQNDPLVYRITLALTLLPAIFDMVNNLPAILRSQAWAQEMIKFASQYLPFFDLGFGWLSLGLGGFIAALLIHMWKNKQPAR
ncbi:branched-chain amino acid transport system II carrier protein [Lactobacillus corticis]|uniref:Branched-chain amino acid transport system carrier protein n=1 Tax=Lactobacillus corticis TaxID=2201249 RepID=A0A916QHF9_9LACO|nr:branched-chain amino acid transport system II carrier protein [Lactobacillus corticis]GFZ26318.1 branched-chain amino acid permease [Lactobacillus corticis]